MTILLGDGSGLFSAAPGSPVTPGGDPFTLVVGDFNEDGHADLAVVTNDGFSLSILLGDGLGGFSQAASPTGLPLVFPSSIALGDFNRDGHQDLVIGSPSNGTPFLLMLLGDGHGGFSEGGRISGIQLQLNVPHQLVVGRPDLAVTDYCVPHTTGSCQSAVQIRLNTGAWPAVTAPPTSEPPPTAGEPRPRTQPTQGVPEGTPGNAVPAVALASVAPIRAQTTAALAATGFSLLTLLLAGTALLLSGASLRRRERGCVERW